MRSERTNSSAAVIDERMFDVDRSVVAALLWRIATALARSGVALGRTLCRHPADSVGLTLAAAVTGVILVNALFLQTSPHPAPILPHKARPVAPRDATGVVVAGEPRGRTAGAIPATRTRAQIVSDIQRELSKRGFFDGPTDGVYGAKTDAAIRDFEQAAGMKPSLQPDEALLRAIMRSAFLASSPSAPRPPAPIATRATAAGKPASSTHVVAVQRALADFGYGPVKPNGILGAETRAAIERFERDRKLPATGQISDRLLRELAAVTGRPLE